MQEGRLLPGSRLPSTRDFARQLRVARGTVVLAYAQLADEGYLHGARGAGTIVVDSLPESWLSARRAARALALPAGSPARAASVPSAYACGRRVPERAMGTAGGAARAQPAARSPA